MKSTTNKIQNAYMMAKARVQEIESMQEEIERKYIADKGIVNPDGFIPEYVWCMDDDAAFDKANEEVSALIAAAGLESEAEAARAALKSTEDRLITYGLSLAPAGVRATLERGVKQNATIRQKVIDATYRLDVSTVPA